MIQKVRVTKIFTFEAAHSLPDYKGPCKNIHGHSYELHVTVIGKIDVNYNLYDGMLIDFKDLKSIVKKQVVDVFDHSLMLSDSTKSEHVENLFQITEKIVKLPFQPSCENLIVHFANQIAIALPPKVSLHHLKLYETRTSYAEWFADDQLELAE